MDTIGDRMKYLRKGKNLTQKKVAGLIDEVSQSTLARIELGIANPSAKDIMNICKFFNVSIDWLLTGEGDMNRGKGLILSKEEIDFINKYRRLNRDDKLRMLERMQVFIEFYEKDEKENNKHVVKQIKMKIYELPVSAGFGTYIGDSGSQYDLLDFNEDDVPKQADYGLRVRGDSMIPLIHDGDIVWVEERSQIDNGAIGIFIHEDEAYCKRLDIEYGGRGQPLGIRLLSLNPEYEPIIIKKHHIFRTLGRVLN